VNIKINMTPKIKAFYDIILAKKIKKYLRTNKAVSL